MQILKNKTLAILIALLLTTSMFAIFVLPTTNAHSPPWTIISYAYLSAQPNPVGVGQTEGIYMWVDTAVPGAVTGNPIRRAGYTLTITAPDGTVSTQTWATISDPTGIQGYYFTPTQVGTYKLAFNYPAQTYIWTTGTPGVNTAYTGDVFTAATATTTLTVQQAPIASPIDSYPLPTNYWTYPIEGQNTYWYTIASNWLGTPYILGASGGYGSGAYQPYGSAPNTAHTMWTKPIQYGGVVGGNNTNIPGEMFYQGGSYNTRFGNALIIEGTLFYQEPYGNSGSGGAYVAVDLLTGQTLWSINASATGVSLVPSFGYLYSFDSPNQHGVVPGGMLIATTTVSGQGTVWRAYEPRTGVLTTMNITNVPGGSAVAGPAGEYLKYSLTNYGTTANPNYYLAQWNSSKVFSTQNAGTFNASLASNYDFNISLNLPPGTWSIGSTTFAGDPLISLGNYMLLIQGTFGGHVSDFGATVSTDPANITEISLNPQTLGKTLWTQSYQQAPGNNTRYLVAWDPTTGVFVFEDKEIFVHWGYSLATGSYLWGPTTVTNDTTNVWNYLDLGSDQIAYGNLYWAGYNGLLYCYDAKTGALKWTYGNGGEGNSTTSGFITPYGAYPLFIATIADGMVYLDTTEHSPNSPLYKGAELRCVNATNGAEIWTIMDYAFNMYGAPARIASGYLVTDNTYDQQIYCYGKGPSALTVTAPDTAAPLGTSVVIRGTVTDISAGTKQNQQAANFPNGVPCISDASMSQWMEYVYMQKPMPTNATGIPVSIDVIDSNGNYRTIGTATTTSRGTYSLTWTPDIPGDYQVIANFAGTNGYWPSSSQTAFAVMPAAPTASPYPQVVLPPTEMYVIGVGIAIIIAVAIVGVVMVMMFRKRP